MGDITTGLSILGTGMEMYGANKDYEAQVEAYKQAQKGIVIETNYALQNYEFDRQQNLIQAINDIQEIRKTSTQQIGAVDTAVLQEIGGGRTAEALMRTTRQQQADAIGSVEGRLSNIYNQIDLNKEQAVLSANLQLRNMARPQRPNMMTTLIKGYSDYLQVNEQQQILKDRREINKGLQGQRRGG